MIVPKEAFSHEWTWRAIGVAWRAMREVAVEFAGCRWPATWHRDNTCHVARVSASATTRGVILGQYAVAAIDAVRSGCDSTDRLQQLGMSLPWVAEPVNQSTWLLIVGSSSFDVAPETSAIMSERRPPPQAPAHARLMTARYAARVISVLCKRLKLEPTNGEYVSAICHAATLAERLLVDLLRWPFQHDQNPLFQIDRDSLSVGAFDSAPAVPLRVRSYAEAYDRAFVGAVESGAADPVTQELTLRESKIAGAARMALALAACVAVPCSALCWAYVHIGLGAALSFPAITLPLWLIGNVLVDQELTDRARARARLRHGPALKLPSTAPSTPAERSMGLMAKTQLWRGGRLSLGVERALERSIDEQWRLRGIAIAEMAADSGWVDPWQARCRGADLWESLYSRAADWWEEYIADGQF